MLSVEIRGKILNVMNCFNKDFNTAFGDLRFLIAYNEKEFIKSEIDLMIDIYKNALKNAELNTDEKLWVGKNQIYFIGNSEAMATWNNKFDKANFTYDDLVDYTEDIKKIKEYDFSLRIPEVVLRDDVNYTTDNTILKKNYIGVLKFILDGKAR